MESTEEDATLAVRHVVVAWEEALAEGEREVAGLRSTSDGSTESLRHRLEAVRSTRRSADAALAGEVAETREALAQLRAETQHARQHVEQVFERLSREVDACRDHIRDLREQLHGPSEQVDHAIVQLHSTLTEHHEATDSAVAPLHEHLTTAVLAAAHHMDEQVAGAVGSVEERITGEWVPAIEEAVHGLAECLERASQAVTRDGQEAHAESQHHAEEVTRQAEGRSGDHLSHSRDRAREAGESLGRSATVTHAAGALAIDGTQALQTASNATNVGLNAALGVLRELQRLFDRLP